MSAALMKRLFPADLHHPIGLHRILSEIVPSRGRVLDLGCGANKDLARYRTAEREVWGVDFNAHSELQHAEWFRTLGADGTIPFPGGTFDVVVAVMVLEHVAKPEAFLREVARVLRPGGVFVGHTISGIHYVSGLRRLIGLLPHSFNQWLVKRLYGRAEEDTFPAYYRLNRRGQLEHACRAAGLGPPSLTRYADPGYFRFSRILHALAVVTDWLLDNVVPGGGRLYFTVTTRKAGESSATRPASESPEIPSFQKCA